MIVTIAPPLAIKGAMLVTFVIAKVWVEMPVPPGVTIVTFPLEKGEPGATKSTSVAVATVGVTAVVPILAEVK